MRNACYYLVERFLTGAVGHVLCYKRSVLTWLVGDALNFSVVSNEWMLEESGSIVFCCTAFVAVCLVETKIFFFPPHKRDCTPSTQVTGVANIR